MYITTQLPHQPYSNLTTASNPSDTQLVREDEGKSVKRLSDASFSEFPTAIASLRNSIHLLSFARIKKGYKPKPNTTTAPLTKTVFNEARDMTRTSSNTGGKQRITAPEVSKGTL
ncbi:hypothetical protein ACP275_06G157500 [Erythranthe tilingii]